MVLMCAALIFPSCKAATGKHNGTDTTGSLSQQTGQADGKTDTAEPETERILPQLPERDYEGYDFKIMSKGNDHPHWVARDIAAEKETGDTINDAVYKRNLAVSEMYNVTFSEIAGNDWYNRVSTAVTAGDDAYDLLELHLYSVVNRLIENQLLLDLCNIPYMDLSMPWYDRNAGDALSIGGKLYATVGDISVMDNDATWIVLFNKKLAGDYNIENLYHAVQNGSWTLELMQNYSRLVSKDLDGNGIMDENDRYGMQNEPCNVLIFTLAAGENMVVKDENDLPVISISTARFNDVYTKGIELLTDTDICMNYADYVDKYPGTDPWTKCMDPKFASGDVLFNITGLNRVTMFRSMEADFGILPIPKYTESDDNYICPVHLWCSSSISVPKTAFDPERTGIVIEALSAESMYTLTPAYYEISLKTKFARDDDSSDMLDLIFSSRNYDLGMMYDWGGIYTLTQNLAYAGNDNLASEYAKISRRAESEMEKSVSAIINENN